MEKIHVFFTADLPFFCKKKSFIDSHPIEIFKKFFIISVLMLISASMGFISITLFSCFCLLLFAGLSVRILEIIKQIDSNYMNLSRKRKT